MHLEPATWAAIESYRQRLERASSFDDEPGVVGASKDLIECAEKGRLEPNVETGVDELMAAIDPARRAS
jgi:hypothetical protein